MKKILLLLITFIISLAITLLFFYTMSWYSFSTFPTKVVLFRIIFCSIFLTIAILISSYILVKKGSKK